MLINLSWFPALKDFVLVIEFFLSFKVLTPIHVRKSMCNSFDSFLLFLIFFLLHKPQPQYDVVFLPTLLDLFLVCYTVLRVYLSKIQLRGCCSLPSQLPIWMAHCQGHQVVM